MICTKRDGYMRRLIMENLMIFLLRNQIRIPSGGYMIILVLILDSISRYL